MSTHLIKSKNESRFLYGSGFVVDPCGSSFFPGLIDETKIIPKMAAESVVIK